MSDRPVPETGPQAADSGMDSGDFAPPSGLVDRNCLSWWFPRLEAVGLPVPETYIVETDAPLWNWLDGKEAPGAEGFLDELAQAARDVGLPCFLRTGHGSDKHRWHETCYVTNTATLGAHVGALTEWSLMGIPGLPTNVWAVRALIETRPLFHAFAGMPIVREFRYFVSDGQAMHRQSYWPPDSIERPDDPYWQHALKLASELDGPLDARLTRLAERAGAAMGGGYYSVDLLEDAHGEWWITDMADGTQSFRWDPEQPTQAEVE